METVKRTSEYTIVKKRNGRYGVRANKGRKWINGDEKVQILKAEGLIKAPEPKPAEPVEEPAEEAAAEAAEEASVAEEAAPAAEEEAPEAPADDEEGADKA